MKHKIPDITNSSNNVLFLIQIIWMHSTFLYFIYFGLTAKLFIYEEKRNPKK